MGLRDELPFTVDAGVGALAGNLLLFLGDTAGRRGRPTRVQGTWDSGGLKGWSEGKKREQQVREGNGRIWVKKEEKYKNQRIKG